jgi:hypothetical protein
MRGEGRGMRNLKEPGINSRLSPLASDPGADFLRNGSEMQAGFDAITQLLAEAAVEEGKPGNTVASATLR